MGKEVERKFLVTSSAWRDRAEAHIRIRQFYLATAPGRTVRVRIELPNPDLALLPDMYADVDIATGSDEPVVAVPGSAVIDRGSRQVVIIDRGAGRFEPRDVKLGRRGDGYVEVTSGVNEGDSVVVNGNFLIDAESNLQSALKGLMATDKEAHQ